MNQNSLTAYINLQDVLTERQTQVYSVFSEGGQYTDVEVADRLSWTINRVTGRIGELIKIGKIEKVGNRNGSRVCEVIGQSTLF